MMCLFALLVLQAISDGQIQCQKGYFMRATQLCRNYFSDMKADNCMNLFQFPFSQDQTDGMA